MTGFETPEDEGTVETVEELLALPWVDQWKTEHLNPADPNQFEYFCWCHYGETRSKGERVDLLMVQMKGQHYVIAFLKGDLAQVEEKLQEWGYVGT